MGRIIPIDRLDRPELEVFTSRTDAQLRSKRKPELGVVIAEGTIAAESALDGGCEPIALLMERQHVEGKAAGLIARCGDVPVYTAETETLVALTGFPLTRGVMLALRRPEIQPPETVLQDARRVALMEGLGDRVNMGAIFRSAAALGVDAVLLAPDCCDPFSRRVVRVSMGTVFRMPWAWLGGTGWDWPEEALNALRSRGFLCAALALQPEALPLDDVSVAAAERLALILGSEGSGLQQRTLDVCDRILKIPMARGIDSLNVAAAAAVAFWQMRISQFSKA